MHPLALRLSAFYLVFFAAAGAFIPYFPLFLQSRGFGGVEIGTLLGLMTATRIVAPYFWGWIADRSASRMRLVRNAAGAATLIFAGVLVHQGYWWLVGVCALYQLLWAAVLPQFEAVTLGHLGARPERYPRIRLWGSVGFVVTALAVGGLLDGHEPGLVPVAVWLLLGAVLVVALLVSEPVSPGARDRRAPVLPLLGQRRVLALLGACALMQASHGPYYVFFTIHLEALGYARGLIGQLWALGVVAEVALFAVMPRLLLRWRLESLFAACFALTALRWVMIALLSRHLGWLLAAQVLHAVSFGLYHGVAIQLVHREFPGARQGRGQALYSSIGFGLGGALGSLGSGYAWHRFGVESTWLGAAGVSVLGGVLVAWGMRR